MMSAFWNMKTRTVVADASLVHEPKTHWFLDEKHLQINYTVPPNHASGYVVTEQPLETVRCSRFVAVWTNGQPGLRLAEVQVYAFSKFYLHGEI